MRFALRASARAWLFARPTHDICTHRKVCRHIPKETKKTNHTFHSVEAVGAGNFCLRVHRVPRRLEILEWHRLDVVRRRDLQQFFFSLFFYPAILRIILNHQPSSSTAAQSSKCLKIPRTLEQRKWNLASGRTSPEQHEVDDCDRLTLHDDQKRTILLLILRV